MTAATARLRIGIAGLGRLGRRHAEALAFSTRHVDLVAACSPVEAERDFAGRELGIAADRLYSDFDAFVADPNLDGIGLVSPTR